MPKGVYKRTKEHGEALSKALTGIRYPNRKSPPPFSEETRELMRANAKRVNGRNWRGGITGDEFASFLCPIGYVREYKVYYQPKPSRKHFILDFALLDTKINIEIDGVWHMSPSEIDMKRDALLRSLGWMIIRIKT